MRERVRERVREKKTKRSEKSGMVFNFPSFKECFGFCDYICSGYFVKSFCVDFTEWKL